MPLEIEIKYLDVDLESLRTRLREQNAQYLNRGFESNVVYDDPSRGLLAKGVLLRLREKNSRFVLTLKSASETTSETAKIYDESETEIANAPAMREIITGLGYAPVLRYEKLREKWGFKGCDVCLDTLPFGTFVEIEGDEAQIAACAQALGLPAEKASKASYHDLNRAYREKAGLAPDESFVFPDKVKATILKRRATD